MDHILGQDHALEIIQRALDSEQVHHAWIFSGPRGVGKATTARAFATILLDPGAQRTLAGHVAADPDGETARLVAAGTHPDLHVIHKELARYSDNRALTTRKLVNLPVDVLREHMIGGKTSDDRVRDAPAYRTPMMGHGKVFIIDEAELIDTVGQNALLKTLEEPPPATYIVLVTSRPERLLPTIRSRCQHVRFGPLDDDAMARWMDAAGFDLPADDRAWIERFADGRPGMAALAVEYGFAAWRRGLDPMLDALASGRFPSTMGQSLGAYVDEFATAWVKNHDNASKDAANKDGARHLLGLLAAHARERLGAAHDDAARVAAWTGVIDLLRAAEAQLEANVNQKQVFENLVVQWSAGSVPQLA